MLTVGDTLPTFSLTAVEGTDPKAAFRTVTNGTFAGKWLVIVAWPKDFTFVCPTEIVGFNALNGDFADRDAQLLGLSTDSDFVHLAWRQSRDDLAAVAYPWLADIKREFARELGILDRGEGVCLRATFIVDPEGVIRFVSVNDLSVGRNPQEVLRVLDALQTDELCPCNWQKGVETLKAALPLSLTDYWMRRPGASGRRRFKETANVDRKPETGIARLCPRPAAEPVRPADRRDADRTAALGRAAGHRARLA
jgi:peroxiredoxin (alkyl hydroperoxide reductase subunit C)